MLDWAYKSYTVLQTVTYALATVVVVSFCFTWRENNGPVHTVETDYVRWVTRVPALSVCPAVNRRYVAQQLSRYSKQRPISPQNVSFYSNLLHPRKTKCPGCPVIWLSGLPSNYTRLQELLEAPCEATLLECWWNDKPFPCCRRFQPLRTKQGVCWSFNSEQTQGNMDSEAFDLVTSHQHPRAELKVVAHMAFSVHVHDRKDVPSPRRRLHVPLGQKGELDYKFSETIALESAWELLPSQRGCALGSESATPGFNVYSHSTCHLQCRARRQIELCGCHHHLLPKGEGGMCDGAGLLCLDKHSKNLTKFTCGCPRTCTGQEIQLVHASLQRADTANIASARVTLTTPPTERTVMYAQTTLVETLVGFACMTRLVSTATLYDAVMALWTLCDTCITAAQSVRHVTMAHIKAKAN